MMGTVDSAPFTGAERAPEISNAPGRVVRCASTVDVSVVVANYNNGVYLSEFFESCLRSTVAPREWIFVDDGSTDDSVDIARRHLSQLTNLRIVTLPSNCGFAIALNEGVRLARGEFIARVDPDDILLPQRLQLQYNVLAAHLADVVGCNAIYYQSDLKTDIGHTNFPVSHKAIVECFKRGELGLLHATVMAKASLFLKYKYVQTNVPAEDYDVFARMTKSGARFMNLRIPGIRYRVHRLSVSNHIRYSTIAKTYMLRDKIFGTRTSPARVWLYFTYIWSYRRGRFARNIISRSLYFAIAAVARPGKVVARLRSILGLA